MIRHRHNICNGHAALVAQTEIKVRFSEVDSMKIVWHGNYVRYFEDGREAFGSMFPGLGYMDIHVNGYTAPIVNLQLQYLRPLSVNEIATLEIRYIETDAAKLCFEYELRRNADGEIAVRGSSVQVFVDTNGNMSLNNPPFYEKWKKRWLKQ